MGAELPRLVVFADDWGRHPSSAQHLVRELLPRWKVDWINTVGTRRPSLTIADAKKVAAKLASWMKPADEGGHAAPKLHPNLTVHSPAHWPGFGAGWERSLNARLFDRALRPLLERAEAVVATAPIVADLAARIPEANWIYYCVDDLAEWPGLDAEALRALEQDFVPRAQRIVVVSEHLRARLQAMGRASDVLTHGFDPAHWAGVAAAHAARAAADAGHAREQPVAVFWGAVDARLDVPIVLALAERCELRLVGPLADPDPRVASDPRIVRTGAVPYADLPRLAAEADVLVMPYADLPVTRAMQPLKLKEYLATGLPVVATALPANRAWADAADLVDEPAAFATRVLERAAAALPAAQARARERLAGETWAEKARQFESWIRRSDPPR
ncbi:MAG: glycosyltransferase [Planctomycetes bacterium]|nr:glycosyltransferase [Planctomycetota bacterium]